MKQDELKKLDNEIGQYAADQTKIIWVDDQTMQIATMMIDSYGDTVYVWVKEDEDHCRVSDGGRILFKLDPNQEDMELYETAADIALGSGYQFDEEHCEIYVDVDRKNVAQAAMKLVQLQVAISYLG